MKKGLTPYGVGSFFIPSATFLLSGRLQSICDIVFGRGFFCRPLCGIQAEKITWESRRKSAEEALCIRYVHLSDRLQANVQHCTWSRNRARPAGRFSEMKAEITKERPGEGVNENP